MASKRDARGRYKKPKLNVCRRKPDSPIEIEHNYSSGHMCLGDECKDKNCPFVTEKMARDGWKQGRRIVEFDILLSNLKSCKFCLLGPIPLTYYNVVDEMQRGLGGYLYVRCQNEHCGKVNNVAYGSTYHEHNKTGMPCFTVNTKLGTAMIDSIGGPDRVNNFLTTLNLKPISFKNMKVMERRAGRLVELVAEKSTTKAAKQAYTQEMGDIAEEESQSAKQNMEMIEEDLGVGFLPDSSPSSKVLLERSYTIDSSDEEVGKNQPCPAAVQNIEGSYSTSWSHTVERSKKNSSGKRFTGHGKRVKLATRFPCKTRKGMSCAVDTAWSKRGFDSLTSHTFFMSKAKYGKKVLKSIVLHRTCATCKWWKKNRPFDKVRRHRCILNHIGSAKMMESVSGVQGVKMFAESGLPVEYIEGDGDNTTIARVHKDLNITLKKRFDRNHVVKNVGKSLYGLHSKNKKLSKNVILHLIKCLKYVFAKNQGDKLALKENLKAIVPHQFGDHSLCLSRFCDFKRNPSDKYIHRSLPFKAPLKDESLRCQLETVFKPVIDNSEKYADLGSSQQCEHANREVSLRAPKSLHYGNSESLDFRVQATSAFINEGRSYISQVNKEAGLSPGAFTKQYAGKQMKRRIRNQVNSALPSIKRRRLILKQERAITQAASETLEGQTYESGVGLESQPDVEELPAAVPQGCFKPVYLQPDQKPTFVMFDLETTDLIRGRLMPHITQIAAVEPQSGSRFNCYAIPKVPIAASAQQITGIVVSDSGCMTVSGEPVEAESVTTAMNKFMTWLERFPCVVLVAHNGRRFDYPVLISAITCLDFISRFFCCVVGFIDSLPVFRKVFPNQESYKQEDLARTLLQSSYAAHNAIEDVEILGHLVWHANMASEDLLKHSFRPNAVFNQLSFNEEKNKNKESLNPLICNGVMKRPTAENVAGSGLNIKHLRKIYDRDGEDGLRNIFCVINSEGKPRVTNTKKVLEDVIPKLAEYFKTKHV